MIYAIIKKDEGRAVGGFFGSWEEYHRATFSPVYYPLFVADLDAPKAPGKTKADKKENARSMAINYQEAASEAAQTWAEYAAMCDYFAALGRKYGLLKEFKGAGIC